MITMKEREKTHDESHEQIRAMYIQNAKKTVEKFYWIAISVLLLICIYMPVAIKDRNQAEVEKSLSQLAAALNAETPKRINAYATLKRVYSKELEIIFGYSLESNIVPTEEQRNELLTRFNATICRTPKFKNTLLKNNVTFRFSFRTGNSVIRNFSFSLKDCY